MTGAADLAVEVIAALARAGQSLATAESLTGGLLGAALTSVPGASAVYLGGAVTYATRLKIEVLGVPAETVARCGVVSAEVAQAMATGVVDLTGSDWALATTGVAGPDEQDGQPAGVVWIGLRGPTPGAPTPTVRATSFRFSGGRAAVRDATVEAALSLLLAALRPV